jgi:hypothetical protein
MHDNIVKTASPTVVRPEVRSVIERFRIHMQTIVPSKILNLLVVPLTHYVVKTDTPSDLVVLSINDLVQK